MPIEKKVWDKSRETNLGHYLFHIGIISCFFVIFRLRKSLITTGSAYICTTLPQTSWPVLQLLAFQNFLRSSII
jgi:hypothetical protein